MPKRSTNEVHVAIVVTPEIYERIKKSGSWPNNSYFKSARTEGGWEAFIGPDRNALLKRASDLATVWEQSSGHKYLVLYGVIAGGAKRTLTLTRFVGRK